MSETKVRSGRRILRATVRFWRLGHSDKSHVGFTTDVSATGVFVASSSPFPTPTEIGLMAEDPTGQFVLSGVVARAVKTHPSLPRVKNSGMGILFHDEENPAAKRLNQMGQTTPLSAAGLPA